MIRIALCVTAAIGLAGCGPTSQIRDPLVDPSQATDARTLTGVYALRQKDGTIHYLHVGSATKEYPANFLKLLWVSDDSPEGLNAIAWPAYACMINQTYIIHIPLPEELNHLRLDASGGFWPKPWERTKVTGYALLQVRETDMGLSIAGINEEFWASAIESGELQGIVTSYDLPKNRRSVDVTSGRSELRQFIEAHFDKAFEKHPTNLRRIVIAP
jgi:hypothetical protein